MKQVYYMNRECGNILTYPEMLAEWAELYDGGDPHKPHLLDGTLHLHRRSRNLRALFARAATIVRAALFQYTIPRTICQGGN